MPDKIEGDLRDIFNSAVCWWNDKTSLSAKMAQKRRGEGGSFYPREPLFQDSRQLVH